MKHFTPPPPRPLARLTILTALLVAVMPLPETAAAQSCPRYIDTNTECSTMQNCSLGEVLGRAITFEADMFDLRHHWLWCTERGTWTAQQWQDDCTRKGWFPVGHIAIGENTVAHQNYKFVEAAMDGATTAALLGGSKAYCVVHKTNPDYAYYYNGRGFVYSRNRCIQDRNGDGTHETAIWGDDNCSPQGDSPTHIPKWVAPWEYPKP